MSALKLGKLPATRDDRDLRFAAYRTGSLPRRPKTFGHENVKGDWKMLGNDRYGDCVFAGGCHETMILTAEAGKQAAFSDTTALRDYGAVTGFTPTDPASDQGTNVRDAMGYRAKTGLVDTRGRRHKIGAYVSIDPKNLNHMLEALYLFGVVGIGVEFPTSAMDQFNAGEPWAVVPGSPIDGGHYVPLVAERRMLECVTWGKTIEVTSKFVTTYCDEAWAFVSPEALKAGKSLEGFDLAALSADLQALRSH